MSSSPRPAVALVSTLRAPREDVLRFVAYHRSLGVRRLHLFLDDPLDPVVAELAAVDGVTATPCTADHWQALGLSPDTHIEARQTANADLALGRARAEGLDWLLHLDADELVHVPGHDLPAWLARAPSHWDAVRFPTLEAIPARRERRHPFEDCRRFKRDPTPGRLRLARLLSSSRYGVIRGHPIGKSATRLAGPAEHAGIHAPTASTAPLVVHVADDAFLLHYDSCTFDAWREKWSRRGSGPGVALQMRPDRRRQHADFLAAEARGSDAALHAEWRRQCLVPPHEALALRALGLVRRIDLPRALFTPAA